MSILERSLNNKFQPNTEECATDYSNVLQDFLASMDANPALAAKWDEHAEKYNQLADLMELHGIDLKLLRSVVDSALELEKMLAGVAVTLVGDGYGPC